jgi:hypothetical protein
LPVGNCQTPIERTNGCHRASSRTVSTSLIHRC